MNRRALMKSSASLFAGAAFSPYMPAAAHADTPVLNDHAEVARTNWSGNFHYSTDHVYAPKSVADVQAIVHEAAKLKPLGSRHCFNNIADSRFAQISMRGLDAIELNEAERTVRVGAGIAYGKLAPMLDAKGFALHNLASLPHITVAGSIATATHGSGIGNGNLATQVSGLQIVTADGGILELSRGKDADFGAAVVHLGALGVITAVTLDLVPAFAATQTVYENLSFDQLEGNLDRIMGAGYSVSLFTTWQGNRATQVWIKNKVAPGVTPPVYASLPRDFYGATLQKAKLHPLAGVPAQNCTEQMGSVGRWYERLPHFKMEFTPSSGEEIQSEFFVPREHAYGAIRAVEELRDQITPHLMITEFRTIAADRLPMSMASGRESFALHFTWKRESTAILQILPAIEARLAPFHARPHWGKVFTMQPAVLQGLYSRLGDFKALAQRLDPKGKFRNEYLDHNLYSG